MRAKIWPLLIAIFMVLAVSGIALEENFDASAQKETVYACSGAVTTNTITIKNTGDVTSVYSIASLGSMAPYTTCTNTEITLEPRGSKNIECYIRGPLVEGSYSLETEVSTLFGLVKVLKQDVKLEKCVNLQLYAKDTDKKSCPCTPVEYEFELKNNGAITEIYHFTLSDYSEYAAFSENPAILGPGESRDVFLYLNLPCSVYGEKTIELTATAEKSEYFGVVSLDLNLDRDCYEYSIRAEDVGMCNFEKRTALIEINNTSEIANTYTFNLDGKDFARFENDTFLVAPKTHATIPLTIDTKNVPSGRYNFTVGAVSERGEVDKADDMVVEVQNCYALKLGIEKTSDDLINCEKTSYGIDIKNPGTKTNTYELKIEGSEILALSKNEVTVAPDSTGHAELNIDVPCNETGKKYAELTVSLLDKSEISESVNLGYDIHSIAEGYMINYEIGERTIEYDSNNVSVIVENVGLKKGTYLLSVNGPDWARLSDNKMTLNVGEGKELALFTTPPNETEEGKYKIDLIAQLENTDVAYKNTFEIKIIRIPWTTKAYNAVKDFMEIYWLFIVLGIIALIALLLAISAIRKAAKVMKERPKAEIPAIVAPKEEVYRLKVEKGMPKKTILWKWLLPLFLILVIIGAAVLLYSNWPVIAGVFAKNVTEDVAPEEVKVRVYADKSELTTIGKTILISENTTIKVIVKNYENNSAAYNIRANVLWIELSTDRIELGPQEAKLFFMTVSPPETGVHKITITLENDEGNYKEKLDLKVINKAYFMKYWLYLVGALAALIILLIAFRRKQKFKVKEEKVEFKVMRERKTLKRISLGIVIVLLIASATYLIYSNLKPALDIDFGEVGNETFRVSINKNEKIVLPLVFENKFESRVTYDIESNADWIEIDDDCVRLYANESQDVNIVMTPGEEIKSGIYTINVHADVAEEDLEFTKTLELYVKEKSLLETFLYWILGIMILILVITLIKRFKKNYQSKKEISDEIREEIKESKKGRRRKQLSLK